MLLSQEQDHPAIVRVAEDQQTCRPIRVIASQAAEKPKAFAASWVQAAKQNVGQRAKREKSLPPEDIRELATNPEAR